MQCIRFSIEKNISYCTNSISPGRQVFSNEGSSRL